MEVVRVIILRGNTYRVLQHSMGFYLIQRKIKQMKWNFFKDWYEPKIFLSRKSAVKYILLGFFYEQWKTQG